MRRDIEIASGDYRVTPFLVELAFNGGKYSLRRLLARFDGNAAAIDVGVYVARKGLTTATLTDAIRAAGEVFANTAVATAADPAPELNVVGDPTQMDVREDEAVYVRVLTGDAAVSGTMRLWL